MVNEWTRDDLPIGADEARDVNCGLPTCGETIDALNRNRDALVENRDQSISSLQRLLATTEADRDRWRRAHSIVEQERDQARRERDEWEEKYLDTDEALHRARASLHEACKVAQSYKVDAYQATERAEAAEARTAPAVSRADVAEALSRCINPEMWNVTFPSVVSEVCDLFGVEAGQAADPLLDKAQEFAALADWELTDREAELLHAVAAHVLGREVK